MIMMAAMARMALRALTCDRKTTETVREEKMDAAGTGPLTILGGLPSIKNPLVVKKNWLFAPLPAPQRKMAKAWKARAANATLRSFNGPIWLEELVGRAGQHLLHCFRQTANRQKPVQLKPHFIESTRCEVWQGSW